MDRAQYINSLKLDIKNKVDIENLLLEYEKGKISRDEFLTITLLSHSITYGKGFIAGFESKSKAKDA